MDMPNQIIQPGSLKGATWHRSRDARGNVTHSLIGHDGRLLAQATRTGRYGADDYPWDWWLAHGVPAVIGRKQSGVTDSLRDAKEKARAAVGA